MSAEFEELNERVSRLESIIQKICPHKETKTSTFVNGKTMTLCNLCRAEIKRNQEKEKN